MDDASDGPMACVSTSILLSQSTSGRPSLTALQERSLFQDEVVGKQTAQPHQALMSSNEDLQLSIIL
jgi:hypothetical protein